MSLEQVITKKKPVISVVVLALAGWEFDSSLCEALRSSPAACVWVGEWLVGQCDPRCESVSSGQYH